MNQAQDLLAIHLGELGVDFISEYRFSPDRKWRLDFYLPEYAVGLEIEGAIWTRGRHTRGEGYQNDIEKYNHATISGIKLLRFPVEWVLNGDAKQFLGAWLKVKAECVRQCSTS